MIVNRVEQQVISKNHPFYKVIDEMCFKSKNLYNYANYIIRQEFVKSKKYISYKEMNFTLKTLPQYKDCMSQPANCTLRLLDKNWKSFFISIKDWNKNPSKYLSKPKPPKYLKKNGRYIWSIPNNSCYLNKNSTIHFRLRKLQKTNWKWKTHAQGRLIQIRFVPKGINYVMEVVTEVEVPNIIDVENKRIVSIDLGVNNFVTLSNNIGTRPIIINGKGIKSINQQFNKQKAKLQSELMERNKQYWSHALDNLSFKRFCRVKNFIHNASHFVIKWCRDNKIDTVVIGKNKNWKQECSMSRKNNQNFIYIPYEIFIQQIQYKAQNIGIKVILTEESYTSGTSFLDGETPCKENYNKTKRIKRGLFQASNKLINSDVNGSLQIMRKVFPNAFSYGIEGNLTPLIINVVKTA